MKRFALILGKLDESFEGQVLTVLILAKASNSRHGFGTQTIHEEDHFLILFMDVSATVSCLIDPRSICEFFF